MSMNLRSPLGRVRGLGSAKDGTGHWWAQRLTALALVPLTLWFVAGVIGNVGADHGELLAWIGHPVTAGLFLLLIGATFYHATLGVQVVIEDYLHNEWIKLVALLLMKATFVVLGLATALAVLSILFA
ncbi:succinate dehydrogenase, hydrophobic membrane anchor protein [Algihabitans albus]|uniref:succinate dehydrogenase, hydrophobic membrane anchor protein n=1 Tax=Algihabitans albus TaxID=2164067 RepID=UPI002E2601C9